jgi:uncharacterized protein YbjQ (UPF0145 family)
MKSKDIATQYGLNPNDLASWLKEQEEFSYTMGGFTGTTVSVDDSADIDALVTRYKEVRAKEEEHRAAEQQKADEAAEAKQRALSSMLITSGFNFDGYTITKYSGYISGDSAVEVERPSQGWFGSVSHNVGDSLMASLESIRREALVELKEAAYALGCNAVVGVDFDYLTLDPVTVTSNGGTLYLPFLFGVTANGNAVIIEKNERAPLGTHVP